MTVYELIQELTSFKPDTEVKFNVKADIDVDVEAEFDRKNEDDIQKVTVTASIDEDFDFDDIEDHERSSYRPNVTINLTY